MSWKKDILSFNQEADKCADIKSGSLYFMDDCLNTTVNIPNDPCWPNDI